MSDQATWRKPTSFTCPQDVTDYLKTLPRGQRSQVISEAIRQYRDKARNN